MQFSFFKKLIFWIIFFIHGFFSHTAVVNFKQFLHFEKHEFDDFSIWGHYIYPITPASSWNIIFVSKL